MLYLTLFHLLFHLLLQKDVIIIVAVILLPIAALIGLTISQVVKSSAIKDDALQAQKDIENFLRVQEFVRRIQVTEMFFVKRLCESL